MPAVDSGTVYGDPHIRTLDGRHLSGLEIEFYSEASGLVKKVPVDWQIIYTRYSAHQAFTKGGATGGQIWRICATGSRDHFRRVQVASQKARWRADSCEKRRNRFSSRREGLFVRIPCLQEGCSKWTQSMSISI